MYRVYNVTLNRYEKIGKGVWLRRCDMLSSLRFNDFIAKNDNGEWKWVHKGIYNWNKLVPCEYKIYKFTDNGREEVALNPTKEIKQLKVTVYTEEDGNVNKHKYLNRRNWVYRGETVTTVDNHEWEDALVVDTHWNGASSSYIEVHSVSTGRTYYVQLRDFMKMLPNMVYNIIYGKFTFVRYSSVFAIKLV